VSRFYRLKENACNVVQFIPKIFNGQSSFHGFLSFGGRVLGKGEKSERSVSTTHTADGLIRPKWALLSYPLICEQWNGVMPYFSLDKFK
jgi:hypothetical protein